MKVLHHPSSSRSSSFIIRIAAAAITVFFFATTVVVVDGAAAPGNYNLRVFVENIGVVTESFFHNDCAVAEGAIGNEISPLDLDTFWPGIQKRTLLRFSTGVRNDGPDDLIVTATPETDPDLFEWGTCHGHWHLKNFTNYELLDPNDGHSVVSGRKQAFCLMDIRRMRAWGGRPEYKCGNPGISAGWADIYGFDLDGQWIDVTGVPEGTYTLRVCIDHGNLFVETNEDDNCSVTYNVVVPPGDFNPPPPTCLDLDEECANNNDCCTNICQEVNEVEAGGYCQCLDPGLPCTDDGECCGSDHFCVIQSDSTFVCEYLDDGVDLSPPSGTTEPSSSPSIYPTTAPTLSPNISPTGGPTGSPNVEPTSGPTLSPTGQPNVAPTSSPTGSPNVEPTLSPTGQPSVAPTSSPTGSPNVEPTLSPTGQPNVAPTSSPTGSPNVEPTLSPTGQPNVAPTSSPTGSPNVEPTSGPTVSPTKAPAFTFAPVPIDIDPRGGPNDACPEEIKILRATPTMTFGTNPGIDGEYEFPIQVVERGNGQITYDVVNTLADTPLDFVYIQHYDLEQNVSCESVTNLQYDQEETLMSLCMHSVPVTTVDIWIVDNAFEGVGDPNVHVPTCCHGKHNPKDSVIHLVFELTCECPAVVS